MADLVVISPDPRGFWHADFYAGASDWIDEWLGSPSSDNFCTAPTREAVEAKVRATWPTAVIQDAADEDDE